MTTVPALEAVSAPLLGTVFSMVPTTGPRAYAQYNAYYRTERPDESAVSSIRRLPTPTTSARINNGGAVAWEVPPGGRAHGRRH